MRKILVGILLLFSAITAEAQKGIEIKVSGGLDFIGNDPWIEGGIITGALIYNFNGTIAVGASYSGSINNTFRIDNNANAYKSSLSELSLDLFVNVLRLGKVKLYLTTGIGQVKAENKEPVPDYISFGSGSLDLKDSAIGFGLGAGGVLNLGGGLYLNFIEYRIRTLSSDFMEMDKGFHGGVGPMHTIKAGVSYVFGAK